MTGGINIQKATTMILRRVAGFLTHGQMKINFDQPWDCLGSFQRRLDVFIPQVSVDMAGRFCLLFTLTTIMVKISMGLAQLCMKNSCRPVYIYI